jgi:hypothetical protein
MYALFALAGVAALGVATGVAYRPAASALAIAWSWIFLIDQTNYLNHGWLLCLLAWLFSFVPASPRTQTVPRWAALLVTGQIALVYLFGAVAKLDADWLSGDVARFFLSDNGATAALARSKAGRVGFAVVGLLFDLLVVPGLLWRRTRVLATLAACVFHLANAWLFKIGVFPWVMLALTPIFWPPAASRAVLERLRLWPREPGGERVVAQPWIAAGFVAWFAVQAALPLRHWLYTGQVNWTEEGHYFSWHMKLRVKYGETLFKVGDVVVDPRDLLTLRQAKKMATRPEMIRQLAHELRRRSGGAPVYVQALASLNGRPWQLLVDPGVDLGRTERGLSPAKWIMPLTGERGSLVVDGEGGE